MYVKRQKGWEIPERLATPESVYLNRRQILAASGFGMAAAAFPRLASAETDPSADLYPAPRNSKYTIEREVTPEAINTNYNNFYEFGTHKNIASAAEALPIRPWEVKIDGLVETEITTDFDTLIRKMPLEERLYRHRCVEAWSMTVPWTGFPVAELVKFAKPLGDATYLRMETFMMPDVATGQKQIWYPWPYVEGISMAEATNDLAFLVTGAYGKPVAKSMGAPLRLHLPWKYGFKSIKSIVKFTFTDEQPVNFWQALAADEYGFWANVNPDVPHPRWSQASERDLTTNDRIPTVIFNGYGEYVADLYAGMEDQPIYM
ncbi:MAG: protein-methionine-sulfoxide reductase catalytic subunit MsrP [Bauldia sp.]|uniref:protein-methionine-sulfoxide reductase catalytic subunit MsrP n=1 Tax=Bauldia sp. TaxID=2575872 RepID=UPI001D9F0E9D|nr:protein-methionine-sulfoxide reductase catalytic subunit MsrP [Bauldia sp.]MCB1494266.1 protein-methionine-sulfoxide reductase catalytic subunit MsrP [Bauldia sp.]